MFTLKADKKCCLELFSVMQLHISIQVIYNIIFSGIYSTRIKHILFR